MSDALTEPARVASENELRTLFTAIRDGDVTTAAEVAERVEHRAAAVTAIARTLDPDRVMPLDRIGALYAFAVLELCGGNKSKASRMLGIDRRAMYRLLEREAG